MAYLMISPHTKFQGARADWRAAGRVRKRGFTVLEVMVAAVVLIFGIVTAITTLQRGLRAVDVARGSTVAAQVMQTEMERLRLKNWVQIQTLQDSGNQTVDLDSATIDAAMAFSCTREIRDLKTDMKEITLVSSWRSVDGRSHMLRFITRYSKEGLYDYLYTAH